MTGVYGVSISKIGNWGGMSALVTCLLLSHISQQEGEWLFELIPEPLLLAWSGGACSSLPHPF